MSERKHGHLLPFVRVVEEVLMEEAKEKRRGTSVSLGVGSGAKSR